MIIGVNGDWILTIEHSLYGIDYSEKCKHGNYYHGKANVYKKIILNKR